MAVAKYDISGTTIDTGTTAGFADGTITAYVIIAAEMMQEDEFCKLPDIPPELPVWRSECHNKPRPAAWEVIASKTRPALRGTWPRARGPPLTGLSGFPSGLGLYASSPRPFCFRPHPGKASCTAEHFA